MKYCSRKHKGLKKFKKKSRESADKENFIIFIIRFINKLFRCALGVSKTRKPKVFEGIKKVILKKTLDLLKSLALNNKSISTKIIKDKKKYYSTHQIKKFFSKWMIQRAFEHVIELIFSGDSVKIFCIRFNFRCCSGKEDHCDGCIGKWMALKCYLKYSFLESFEMAEMLDLDVENYLAY